MARETFLRAAGPALVVEAAEILGARGISVMPLKGVLLQRLVYDPTRFRPIVDVDVLVPEARFGEAYEALRSAGFSEERWEPGGWQVSLKRPNGILLGIDLHHRLSRTVRSRLTGDGLFQRGTRDEELFGIAVTLPSHEDLLAHLLLHATLHWIRYGRLHRPRISQPLSRRSHSTMGNARSICGARVSCRMRLSFFRWCSPRQTASFRHSKPPFAAIDAPLRRRAPCKRFARDSRRDIRRVAWRE
jgi:hypothetical protein